MTSNYGGIEKLYISLLHHKSQTLSLKKIRKQIARKKQKRNEINVFLSRGLWLIVGNSGFSLIMSKTV